MGITINYIRSTNVQSWPHITTADTGGGNQPAVADVTASCQFFKTARERLFPARIPAAREKGEVRVIS